METIYCMYSHHHEPISTDENVTSLHVHTHPQVYVNVHIDERMRNNFR